MPWRILLVTLFASTLSNMDQSLFGYAVPGVMRDLKISLDGIGMMISASFALAMISAPFLASRVPRWGTPAVLTASVAGSAVFVGLLASVTSAPLFAAIRVIGFGISAAVIPVSSAYLATHSPNRGRALLIAVQQCGYPMGWFAASIFAAPLMSTYGWRSPFFAGYAVIPLSGLIYWLLPNTRRDLPDIAPTVRVSPAAVASRDLFKPGLRRRTVTLGAAFFLYGGAIGGTSFYLPTFFEQARGYDVATATRVVGLSYAIGMFGYVGAAIVSELWLSRVATVVLWLVVATAGLLATIWLPHTVREDTIAFGLTTIFYYGAGSIMLTCLLESFPARLCAAAASIAGTACICAGFVVFPLLTAATVAGTGWRAGFSIVIVPAVLAAGLLIASLPRAQTAAGAASLVH